MYGEEFTKQADLRTSFDFLKKRLDRIKSLRATNPMYYQNSIFLAFCNSTFLVTQFKRNFFKRIIAQSNSFFSFSIEPIFQLVNSQFRQYHLKNLCCLPAQQVSIMSLQYFNYNIIFFISSAQWNQKCFSGFIEMSWWSCNFKIHNFAHDWSFRSFCCVVFQALYLIK